MKKRNIIILIILFIITIGSFIFTLIKLLLPNEPIQNITQDKFITIMENYNCKVNTDIEKNNNIELYYITEKDSCPYLISYTIFNNTNSRNEFYKQILKEVYNNNNITGRTRIDIGNNYVERETNGDYYKSAILNNNTVLYISTNKEYRDTSIQIKKDLGYHYEPNWNALKYLLIPSTTFIIMLIYLLFLIIFNKKTTNNLTN